MSNEQLLKMITNNLEEKNISIIKERYQMFNHGESMIGFLGLGKGKGPLQMMLGLRNSYDKSRSIALAAGAMVIICSNGMLLGDVTYMRKHTGEVLNDIQTMISNSIDSLVPTLYKAHKDMEIMQKKDVNPTIISQILGELFYKEELLKITQLSVVKKEINTSKNFSMLNSSDMNMWNLYNNVTESLKKTNMRGLETQSKIHDYFLDKSSVKTLNISGEVLQNEPIGYIS